MRADSVRIVVFLLIFLIVSGAIFRNTQPKKQRPIDCDGTPPRADWIVHEIRKSGGA